MTPLQMQLFELQDEIYRRREDYRDFQARVLVVDAADIIGVRTPVLRKFAKEFEKLPESEAFLKELPHLYHEEKQLHAFLISQSKDFEFVIAELDRFLPTVDNWATCDSISPKSAFRKHLDELVPHIDRWMASSHEFTIRFGIEMLMSFYLDKAFKSEYLSKVAAAKNEAYYVRMMVAWYFATALAKQWDATIPYLQTQHLATWTHNKAIQKAIESYRIADEQKAYLRTLKIRTR